MKRSEMVKKISIELEDINMENYYDEKGSEWCANLLLMFMEEQEMLPPEIFRTWESGHGFGKESLGHKWEPEDDK